MYKIEVSLREMHGMMISASRHMFPLTARNIPEAYERLPRQVVRVVLTKLRAEQRYLSHRLDTCNDTAVVCRRNLMNFLVDQSFRGDEIRKALAGAQQCEHHHR